MKCHDCEAMRVSVSNLKNERDALIREVERLQGNAKEHVDAWANELADNIVLKSQLATLRAELEAAREWKPNFSPHTLLHRLWTKAVGQETYVKDEWRQLETLVLQLEKV